MKTINFLLNFTILFGVFLILGSVGGLEIGSIGHRDAILFFIIGAIVVCASNFLIKFLVKES